MSQFPQRKHIRLSPANYLGQKYYFATICSHLHKKLFENADLAAWLLNSLKTDAAAKHFRLHAYCLMPDHLHLLAEGILPNSDLRSFLNCFKVKSSRHFSLRYKGVLWQKRYYDHILRSADSVQSVCWYIWLNPVRKGLAAKPGDYPFSGSSTGRGMPSLWNKIDWCPPWKRIGVPISAHK